MKIAMFGGSFNPVHNGHIQLAETFAEKLGLDRVIIVPAYVSPFKQSDISVAPLQRLEMCRMAFANMDIARVSDIEIKREGPSYTYITLEMLADIYANDKIYLITGADMFMTVHTWEKSNVIFKLAEICGIPRNDSDVTALKNQAEFLESLGAKTKILDSYIMPVSSTLIRELIKNGKDISGLVPHSVENYIIKNGLYK